MKTNLTAIGLAGLLGILPLAGCKTEHTVKTDSTVRIEPIEVKPIYMTLDINIRVEKELDDFFSDVAKRAEESMPPGVTAEPSSDAATGNVGGAS